MIKHHIYKHNCTELGLYITKTIIEKYLNGIIKVYNKKGGACFEIQLPYDLSGDTK